MTALNERSASTAVLLRVDPFRHMGRHTADRDKVTIRCPHTCIRDSSTRPRTRRGRSSLLPLRYPDRQVSKKSNRIRTFLSRYIVGVTLFEASTGGLFIPAEAGVRPGNFITIPPQAVDVNGNISIPYGGAIRARGSYAGRTPAGHCRCSQGSRHRA